MNESPYIARESERLEAERLEKAKAEIRRREEVRVMALRSPDGLILLIRKALDEAEKTAKELRDQVPMDEDAYDRADELCQVISDLFPDHVKPCEDEVKDWQERNSEP